MRGVGSRRRAEFGFVIRGFEGGGGELSIRWRCEGLVDEPAGEEAFGSERGEEDGKGVEEEDEESEEGEPEPGEVELVLRIDGVRAEEEKGEGERRESQSSFELAWTR